MQGMHGEYKLLSRKFSEIKLHVQLATIYSEQMMTSLVSCHGCDDIVCI